MNEKYTNTHTILIVEDDLGLLHLIQKKIRQLGYNTEGVSTGEDAISMIKSHKILLVLLDYQLTDMTCKNVIENIASTHQLPPFIIMTGHGNEKIAVEMMKLGAIDYLVKDSAFLDLLPSVVKRTVDHLTLKNELRSSEEMSRSLLENINVGVFLISPQMEILAVNKKMQEWFPYIDENKNPICFKEITNSPKDKACSSCPAIKAFRDGKTYETLRETMVNGSPRNFRIVASSINDEEGNVIRAIVQIEDHTDKVLALREKEKLEAELRQSHKMQAIGTLAGGIAHDFNNILAAILGYADMAMEDIPEHSPARSEINEVLKAGNRAKELIKHILSFSRKEAQKQVPVPIHQIVREALKLLRASIPTTIKIRQNLNPKCGNILAQSTQIHQIIMNICTNAAQAMDDAGGMLEVSLDSCELVEKDIKAATNSGKYIQLSVKDTGPGIAGGIHDRIFDPYFTTKETGKGSGMGLAVVHGLVKAHDGMINFESKPGEGTTFHVYFPKIEDRVQGLNNDYTDLPRGSDNEHILIVDDEESIVKLTKRRVERLGYNVTALTSSQEAFELFRSQPDSFDLVLSDQTMPDYTGEQLANKILEIRPDIPIVICTGYSSKLNMKKADNIGVRALIMKPVEKSDLAQTLRKALDNNVSPH